MYNVKILPIHTELVSLTCLKGQPAKNKTMFHKILILQQIAIPTYNIDKQVSSFVFVFTETLPYFLKITS